MATQRPHDAFPVRVSGAPCEGCSVVGTRRIELTRPRSTIRKAFDLGLVCGDDGKKFKTRSGDATRLVDRLLDGASRSLLGTSL